MKKSFLTLSTFAAFVLLNACGGESQKVEAAPSSNSVNSASAAKSSLSPKAAVEERERLMKAFKKDFGLMGKMAKGDMPYDAAAFKAAAESLNANANKPWVHYTVESSKEKSEAKSEVWSKPAEFKKEADKFVAAVAQLKIAAAAGNIDAVKKPMGEVGQSCKSCHDSFRED